jgi:hypothetical protein
MRIPQRTAACFALSVLGLLVPSSAFADDKQECVAAYEKSQQLRDQSHLRQAREQLAICSRPACPALVRQDCTQWMGEVLSSLPSVVIGARDANGQDIVAVKVFIDEVLVAEQLDGKPVPLDPGVHRFRFEQPNGLAHETQVLLREGEKNRVLTVNFPAAAGETSTTQATLNGHGGGDHAQDDGDKSAPILAYVLAGIGTVGLGAAIFLDLKANGDASTLRTVCAPNCDQSDVDGVQAKYVAAAVSLGVGVVSLGVATYLFLAPRGGSGKGSASLISPEKKSDTALSNVRFDFTPTAHGGGVASFGASF